MKRDIEKGNLARRTAGNWPSNGGTNSLKSFCAAIFDQSRNRLSLKLRETQVLKGYFARRPKSISVFSKSEVEVEGKCII